MAVKQELYTFCKTFVEDRIKRVQSQIKEVQMALATETKSSAGDKHETGRAMLQLEREKLGQQLVDAEKMMQLLYSVDIFSKKNTACLGSLVKTTGANYFLAISAGEYKAGPENYYCISLNTPIGIMLLGKSVGEAIRFNTSAIEILEII